MRRDAPGGQGPRWRGDTWNSGSSRSVTTQRYDLVGPFVGSTEIKVGRGG